MKKSFEAELPAGYREVFSIDAANKKIGLILNVAAAVVTLALIVLAVALIRPNLTGLTYGGTMLRLGILCAAMLVYIVLHELTHGAAYKLLTKQKLKFGLTMTVAYCGVPDIYVYRKTALISLLAPLAVFGLVFGLAALLLPTDIDRLLAAILFSLHIGGCAGDIYDAILFLFKFRSPKTLMRDTGPMQTFYLPQAAEEGEV